MQVAQLKQYSDPRGEASHPFEPGYVIGGRYRIIRALGRGGMGTVYLAEDLVLGESGVAIKVLHRGGPEDHAATNRFLREVRLTHKIQHENVVRTFDFGQDGDSIFYTMEYLSGQSLQVAISEGGLPYRTVIDMAGQLMRGLAAVHAVGVVHRDLKPANVIVSGDGTLKITDFGIARSSAAPATMFASDVFGTLRYVAPEVLRGEPTSHAVDFYALGVVLFELLTGTAPFRENNPAQLIIAKIEEPAASVRALREDAPAWLLEGVDGLLERDPGRRMQAVRAFASALDTYAPYRPSDAARHLSPTVTGEVKVRIPQARQRVRGLHVRLSVINALWVALCALFVLPIAQTESFLGIEANHADTLFRLRGPTAPHPGIMVVSMDEQSYLRLGVPLTAPWPRALHAKLLSTLAEAGAKRVVFDVIFADASYDNDDDRALAEAMKKVPTVLGAALGVSHRATINGAFLLEELLQPAELFETESVGVGVVGLPIQFGRVRQFPKAESEVFPSVNTLSEMSVALDRPDTAAAPRGALLNFYGPGRSIPTIPYELVVSDSLEPLPRSLFEGKIVFVGLGLRSSTGASQRDAFITPYDHQTFGAEIHATAASNLLQQDWIKQPSRLSSGAITLGCAALLSLLICSLSGGALIATLFGALVLIAALQFFVFLLGWLIPVVTGSVWGVFSGLLLKTIIVQPSRRFRRSEP
jgi:CHASE2 domain-containing sensor protein